jgi:hypothetical protein
MVVCVVKSWECIAVQGVVRESYKSISINQTIIFHTKALSNGNSVHSSRRAMIIKEGGTVSYFLLGITSAGAHGPLASHGGNIPPHSLGNRARVVTD